ncbi:helix-turn-helix domain-containing protein [Cupriavidus basilensis]|uniref:helix-turn-helix domain-containing protein n=1 Tax=Cupriavidus basilensis TaxID=68895 RepID=UPI0039F6BB65
MPKKLLHAEAVPSLVAERLRTWGRCIRTQRVAQHIPAADLCARMGISDATLRRVERGDPGAGAATYLTALLILGLLDMAAPPPDPRYWATSPHARARPPASERDDDYF